MSVESIITENLDIWTSAIKTKSASGRGSSNKLELYGIKKLRELILDLAVRGKLVQQDLNDEPASLLLSKIEEEKKKLVKEKIIKKPKALPPLEVSNTCKYPKNWECVRLGNIGYWAIGSGIPTAIQGENGKEILVCKVSDMNLCGNEKFIRSTVNSVSVDTAKERKLKIHPEATVIFPKIGGAIATNKRRMVIRPTVIDNNCLGITPYIGVAPEYLYIYLSSIDMTKYQAGTSVPALSQGTLELIEFGLPPLREQKQIVLKVDELMTLCDQLESQTEVSIEAHQTLVKSLLETLTNARDADELNESWQRISEHFDVLFTTEDSIDQLKQTILQLAVMGKLVKQDPNDEPASKLLERIAAEKELLIKDKKIKKQKPLAPITEAERWFSSPDSWSWIRLGELGYILGGGTPSKAKKEFWGGDIPWVSPKDMKLDFIENALDTVTDEAVNNTSASMIPVGSLLMVVRGMILAHSFPVAISKKALIINQDMKALVFTQVLPEYLLLIMKAFKGMIVDLVDRSSHGTCKLVSEKLFNIALPIPPKNEQERILEKLSKLEKLQDALKSKIAERCLIERNICDAIAIDNQCRTSQPSSDNCKYKLSEDELLKQSGIPLGASRNM